MPPPSNLQVLPKDMTSQQVVAIMRTWEKELGVECETCHAKDPATGRNNFASDANPLKNRARVMLKMTRTINAEYLTQLTDPKPTQDVSCGTCHRGELKPVAFVPPPPAPRNPPPPPAAAPTPTR
jgi:mono/diheme cytochrome c family protein